MLSRHTAAARDPLERPRGRARLNCAAPRRRIRAPSERAYSVVSSPEKDTHEKGIEEVSRFGRRPKTPECQVASGNTEQLPRWAATFIQHGG